MTSAELETALRAEGYSFVRAADLRGHLGSLADWEVFAASWNDLRADAHQPEGDRLRRHAVFSVAAGRALRREPAQAHVQAAEYNRLHGGVERWFEPIAPEIAGGATMQGVLAFCAELFGRLRGNANWKIELHQFRILARNGLPGRPTPEGVHRDGVDCVLAMLVRRENVASGTTTVHAVSGETRGSFTLTEPFDAALVDDARVMHGVTPVTPLDPEKPAYRDVLVATFKRA